MRNGETKDTPLENQPSKKIAMRRPLGGAQLSSWTAKFYKPPALCERNFAFRGNSVFGCRHG
jgi:hypothetical protein